MSRRQDTGADGFKRNPKYKRRKQRTGKVYPWVHQPVGIFMKILIGLIGDNMVDGVSLAQGRDFKGNGITGARLHGELIRFCWWADTEYLSVRGLPLTDNIVYDRFHKMYYENGKPGEGGKPIVSKEHYTEDTRLRPHVEAVKTVFLEGKPVSRVVAECLINEQMVIL